MVRLNIVKIISELLAVDLKVDKEDWVLVLLSSLLESLIIFSPGYSRTKMLIEVTTIFLANKILRRPIRMRSD